jgi:hypothetical protein
MIPPEPLGRHVWFPELLFNRLEPAEAVAGLEARLDQRASPELSKSRALRGNASLGRCTCCRKNTAHDRYCLISSLLRVKVFAEA